ncbi:MAG TPA: hypothetical protein VEY06_01475 [Flavisolibacter sp.]|nr:hypothetical protein [Flavisolibacter sp.]
MEKELPPGEKRPIINCHTHLFTGDHVPPLLAKTVLPWPIYYLVSLSAVIPLFRFWYRGPYTWQFKPLFRKIRESWYHFKMTIHRTGLLRAGFILLSLLVTLSVFFILVNWLTAIWPLDADTQEQVSSWKTWLEDHYLLYVPTTTAAKIFLVVLLFVLFKGGRRLVWLLLRRFWSVLGLLPGPQTAALARRYLTIGRFSFYKSQARIFGQLRDQYPPNSAFVVLPMDMEYMGAGGLKRGYRYHDQMQALAFIKQKPTYSTFIYPFVFADPRRFRQEGAAHFDYTPEGNAVVLKDCFIRRYIENYRFSGFKIYPALGYYPFDETLLPLWKYAADHALPIMTHCIRGTIYYRGAKEKAWDYHPIIQQACGNGVYEALHLPERTHAAFCNNFTHPLNYLCLLKEPLLRQLVGAAKDPRIRALFGYTNAETKLTHSLEHLKICFAHFGGEDEWERFLESDRDNYSKQLVTHPLTGVSFLTNDRGDSAPGKLEQLWKYADWYTIICSLMLQYDQVYADVSYILHQEKILPLLKQTLANKGLKEKILFGTDFYVVRNHKSEKHLLASMTAGLTEEEFDLLARINPRRFLYNHLHSDVSL